MMVEVGSIVDGKVTGVTKFGAFVELPDNHTGMVHISEISNTFVKNINDHLHVGDAVKVKVIGVNEENKISLSIKKALPESQEQHDQRRQSFVTRKPRFEKKNGNEQHRSNESLTFEDMMSKFMQSSDEKMSDLKKSLDSKRGGYSRRGGNSLK